LRDRRRACHEGAIVLDQEPVAEQLAALERGPGAPAGARSRDARPPLARQVRARDRLRPGTWSRWGGHCWVQGGRRRVRQRGAGGLPAPTPRGTEPPR